MANKVFFYVPNLIGYARIILAISAIYQFSFNPFLAISLYAISSLLDAFDGYAARYLNQVNFGADFILRMPATQFGAVLDMVTDRSTTSCLLVQLALLYPKFTYLFQLLIALDLSSHYMQMYSSLTSGSKSHKIVSPRTHPLLRIYYTSRFVLFSVCAGNEVFFMLLYTIKYTTDSAHFFQILIYLTLPIFLLKQVLNVVQLISASNSLANEDLKKSISSKK